MINNKKILRIFDGIALLIAASLLTCVKMPENYCGDYDPPYNPYSHFCGADGTTYPRCGEGRDTYIPGIEDCKDNRIVTVCGDGSFVTRGDRCEGYTLTINVTPPASGTVHVNNGDASPGRVNVGAGAHTVEARPNTGYIFAGWLGAATGTINPTLLEVDDDKSLTAMFRSAGGLGETEHVLIASASPSVGGTVFVNNVAQTGESTTHDHGAAVTVHAVAAEGYTFSGWAGDLESTQQYATITMDDTKMLVATFEATMYSLTVNASPQAGGTVSPANISNIIIGTQVPIVAEPRAGYMFQNWAVTGGTASIANDRSLSTTVTVNSTATVTAIFEQIPPTAATYSLIVTKNVEEGGTTSPAASQAGIAAGTPVNISATPSSGYVFVEWTVTSGTASFVNADFQNTTVILRSDATIRANFRQAHTLTVDVGPSGGGTVSPMGQSTVTAGTQVSITATAASGYMFLGWSVIRGPADIAEPKSASTTVTLSGDATVIASFSQTYTLTVHRYPPDGGTTSPESSRSGILSGQGVNIAAFAASGYTFQNWSVVGGAPTIAELGNATTTVTLNSSDAMIIANFQALPIYTLTVNVGSSGGGTVSPAGQSTIAEGMRVGITASPAQGYRFLSWSVTGGMVDNPNSASASVTVNANVVVTANFQQLQTYTLTVGRSPTGGGTTTPAGNQAGILAGETVSISATANSGYRFLNWAVTSGAATITDPGNATTTVTVGSSSATVTAYFQQVYTLTVNVGSSGGGTVSPAGQSTVTVGTQVSVTATPEAEYRFVNWTGITGANATSAAIIVTVNTNMVITANFQQTGMVAGPPLVDPRDGQTYNIVKIGNQWWMAENLNYATTATNTDSSWCYRDSASYCAKYGRWYNWYAARNQACQGIGDGWHLPDTAEWDVLVAYAGGYLNAASRLKTTTGWEYNGIGPTQTAANTYGFSALPGGLRSAGADFGYGDGSVYEATSYTQGHWWGATDVDEYYRYMWSSNNAVGDFRTTSIKPSRGYSVRCVKNP